MKIANEIANEFFLLEKMLEFGFTMIPGEGNGVLVSINEQDLKKYFKAIYDKIKEIESDTINNV